MAIHICLRILLLLYFPKYQPETLVLHQLKEQKSDRINHMGVQKLQRVHFNYFWNEAYTDKTVIFVELTNTTTNNSKTEILFH